MKKIILFTLIVTLFFLSCSSSNYKKDSSGLEYILFQSSDANGQKIQMGDLVEMSLSYYTETDVELFNSNNNERKYLRKVSEISHRGGCFEDGLMLLSVGDSAIFRILADDFLLKTERFNSFPEDVKSGDMIIVKVKIINILDKEDADKIITNKYHVSEEKEHELLIKYLINSNMDTIPNSAGVFLQVLKSGKGETVNSTSVVSLDFMLTLIDGTIVETSFGKQPLTFKVDSDEMIKGLNDGVKNLHVGDSVRMIIPSKLAYGKQGSGKVQAFSSLIFVINILNVE